MTRAKQSTNKVADDTSQAVDLGVIVAALRKHPKWLEAMKALAGRERIHATSTFHRLRRDLHEKKGNSKWTYEEIAEFFTALQGAGAGELYLSEDKDPEFHWNFYYKDIVNMAIKSATSGGKIPQLSPEQLRESKLRKGPLPRPQLVSSTPASASFPAPTVVAERGSIIQVHIGGAEFELDLKQIPPELLKFRRMI